MPTTPLATTHDWISYALSQQLLLSVPPLPAGACDQCHGSVGRDASGEPYQTCWHCTHYVTPFEQTGNTWHFPFPVVTRLVPISYSLDSGLESLLHNYKQGAGPVNVSRRILLASVLHEFLRMHRACLETIAGPFGVATTVPPRVPRSFRPMADLQGAISGTDPWSGLPWNHDVVQRLVTTPHTRGQMDPDFYGLAPGIDVTDATVLLVDDTWTSGASLASVALRLRQAGARNVVGLTIGRQIGTDNYGTTQEIRTELTGRTWDNAACVVCG